MNDKILTNEERIQQCEKLYEYDYKTNKEVSYRDHEGAWNFEPNAYIFTDEITQLECVILRHAILGHFCGYVTLPDNYKVKCIVDFRKMCQKVLNVHGGITFVGAVFNKPSVGFDCSHFNDLVPSLYKQYENMPFAGFSCPSYKDIEYVKAECRKLAKQIYKLKQKGKI